MKIRSMHQGDRSEYLAEYALSTIGFTTKVPRVSDHFGIDFIVSLFNSNKFKDKKENDIDCLIPTGYCFAVQIKSDTDVITLKNDLIDAFLGVNIPFFIGVVDKNTQEMSIYTTMTRLHLKHQRDKISTLKISFNSRKEIQKFYEDDGIHWLYLGEPVSKTNISDLDQETMEKSIEKQKQLMILMYSWIVPEVIALAWNKHGIPWIPWPNNYTTDKLLKWDSLLSPEIIDDKDALHSANLALYISLLSHKSYLTQVVEKGEGDSIVESITTLIDQLAEELEKGDTPKN